MRTIAGLFDERGAAERAVDALAQEGIEPGRIDMVVQEVEVVDADAAPKKRSFLQRLFGIGVPEDDAHVYAEGIRRGRTLVTVQAADDEVDLVEQCLERYDPVDIQARGQSLRSRGWQGYEEEAAPYSRTEIDEDVRVTREAEQRIPIAEEQLRVGKQAVPTGRVRVRSYVREIPVTQDVELRSEHATVERRPVAAGQTVAGDAFQERSVEVETFAEEGVAQKQTRVVEEVVVGKEVNVQQQQVRDTVKRTEVEVDDDAKRSPTGR